MTRSVSCDHPTAVCMCADLEELQQPLGKGNAVGQQLVGHHPQTLWLLLGRAAA